MKGLWAWKELSVAKNGGRRTFGGKMRYARVEKVYDGDTIYILTKLDKGETYYQYSLRIAGIDTPEIRPSGSTPDRELHKEAGNVVKDFVKELLPPKTMVVVKFHPEDKYGRLLGSVHLIKKKKWGRKPELGDELGELLVKKGYAKEYMGGTKEEFSTQDLEHIVGRGKEATAQKVL